jgi:hypothetical protein
MRREAFFVGWSPRSALPLAGFLAVVVLTLLVGLGGLALALGSTVNDPGGGDFTGEQALSGVLVAQPYPVLVLNPDAAHPAGHAVLLSGGGKRGVQPEAASLDGRRVHATGYGVKRGSIDMLLVDTLTAEPGEATRPANMPAAVPPEVPLGTWRLTGEICDGKCMLGVMRPGTGLAHKACANICLGGGVPPVLVSTAPVAGSQFLLMGDPDGHALPDVFRDHTAIPQRMDGMVTRLADLLVFRTDVSRAIEP